MKSRCTNASGRDVLCMRNQPLRHILVFTCSCGVQLCHVGNVCVSTGRTWRFNASHLVLDVCQLQLFTRLSPFSFWPTFVGLGAGLCQKAPKEYAFYPWSLQPGCNIQTCHILKTGPYIEAEHFPDIFHCLVTPCPFLAVSPRRPAPFPRGLFSPGLGGIGLTPATKAEASEQNL